MPILLIAFPDIDPVLVHIGPLPIRWYALAYIFGLIGGWLMARFLCARPGLWGGRVIPSVASIDDLLLFSAIGAIVGGRLFQIVGYNWSYYTANPSEIVMLWKGGMAFHGGLIGVALGAWFFARRERVPILSVADLCAAVAPLGIFFGRLANFIKPELWGRPTDVSWAMVFPGSDGAPRHPSQLYEAGLEGLALLVVLWIVIARGGLKRPGLVCGLFAIGYACARIFSEFYRDPDPDMEKMGAFLTAGMVYSAPMIPIGIWLIVRSRGRGAASAP